MRRTTASCDVSEFFPLMTADADAPTFSEGTSSAGDEHATTALATNVAGRIDDQIRRWFMRVLPCPRGEAVTLQQRSSGGKHEPRRGLECDATSR